jgi:hypothetical protein
LEGGHLEDDGYSCKKREREVRRFGRRLIALNSVLNVVDLIVKREREREREQVKSRLNELGCI